MDQSTSTRVREIKAAIGKMLEERHRLGGSTGNRERPSTYWASFCSRFSYMLGLPEEAFEQLRIHTYHLTGDSYLTYFFDAGAREFRRERAASLDGIPAQYWLYEPNGGIGFSSEGGLVSHDTQRFQHVVNTLYREGTIEALKRPVGGRSLVLEIGAGYGGLAHHLTSLLDLTYVIVDLPETLLFSASYLAMLHPTRNSYIYSPETFAEFLKTDVLSYDFVFIPNYRVEELGALSFDLVLNVASFQEMREDQVGVYLDFISRTCGGTFFSWNQDAQPKNGELHSLSEMLRQRFALKEVTWVGQDRWLARVLKAFTVRAEAASLSEHLRGLAGRIFRSAAWRIDPLPAEFNRPYREFICATRSSTNSDAKAERNRIGTPPLGT